MAFVIQGLQSTFEIWLDDKHLSIEYFGLVVFALFSPIAWVRKIDSFKSGMILGTFMIVITLIVISCFCIKINIKKSNEADIQENSGFEPVNYGNYWTMIGFSFFMYEGIGGVMPLMAITKDRASFPRILKYAFATLTTIYILFAELCYYTFGSDLKETIIKA